MLEHPAFSKAWAAFGMPRPQTKDEHWTQPDEFGGRSAYVEQGRYGHPVKKATWLYAVGVDFPELRWGHTPDSRGTLTKNQDWKGGMDAWRNATGSRVANATPPEFREELVAMAESVKGRGERDSLNAWRNTVSKKDALVTPDEFREELVAIARSVEKEL